MFEPGHARLGGRRKGTPNKTTADLKEAILRAAEIAGGKEGLVGYLTAQAAANPPSFMALLGKVLPKEIEAAGAIVHEHEHRYVTDEDRVAALAEVLRRNGGVRALLAPPRNEIN